MNTTRCLVAAAQASRREMWAHAKVVHQSLPVRGLEVCGFI